MHRFCFVIWDYCFNIKDWIIQATGYYGKAKELEKREAYNKMK